MFSNSYLSPTSMKRESERERETKQIKFQRTHDYSHQNVSGRSTFRPKSNEIIFIIYYIRLALHSINTRRRRRITKYR